MRAVIQRVTKASVSVGDELVSSIGKGLCVLVGVSRDDKPKDIDYIVRKILNLRVFEDDQDKRWSKSVMDKNYEVLCVSQFTLYAVMKGNKPDFHCSMAAEDSKDFYNDFLAKMKSTYKPDMIKDGQFGAMMQVHIQNDGPVTITFESPQCTEEQCKQQKGKAREPRQPKEAKQVKKKDKLPEEPTAASSTEENQELTNDLTQKLSVTDSNEDGDKQ